MKTYTRILDYLEATDKDFSSLIKGLCLEYLFNPKGKPGITLLLPIDAEFRKKIFDLAESGDVNDAYRATDLVSALVIPDNLKSTDDFKNKADDIPNALGQAIEIDVKGSGGADVKLKCGGKFLVDKKFKDVSTKQNLNVYTLSNCPNGIPTDGKPASFKYIKRAKAVKAASKGKPTQDNGALTPTLREQRELRCQIAAEVENAYLASRLHAKKPNDPYLRSSLSLVNHILHNTSTETINNVFINKMLPLLSFTKIDFYLFVEPFREEGEYLIPHYLIEDWQRTNSRDFNLQSIINAIYEALAAKKTSADAAKVFTNRIAVLEAIDLQRQYLQKEQPRRLADRACDIYASLSSTNKIGGLDNIFPPALADLYKREPNRKIIEDELRYITWTAFEHLESAAPRQFSRSGFDDIIETISDYMSSAGGVATKCLKILNRDSLKFLIAPNERVNDIKVFLNSTMFLFVPLTPDDLKKMPHDTCMLRPDPESLKGIWNIHALVTVKQRRLLDVDVAQDHQVDTASTLKILKNLQSIDIGKLDADTRKLIEELAEKSKSNTTSK